MRKTFRRDRELFMPNILGLIRSHAAIFMSRLVLAGVMSMPILVPISTTSCAVR